MREQAERHGVAPVSWLHDNSGKIMAFASGKLLCIAKLQNLINCSCSSGMEHCCCGSAGSISAASNSETSLTQAVQELTVRCGLISRHCFSLVFAPCTL